LHPDPALKRRAIFICPGGTIPGILAAHLCDATMVTRAFGFQHHMAVRASVIQAVPHQRDDGEGKKQDVENPVLELTGKMPVPLQWNRRRRSAFPGACAPVESRA
jgi:hypothetical protein